MRNALSDIKLLLFGDSHETRIDAHMHQEYNNKIRAKQRRTVYIDDN